MAITTAYRQNIVLYNHYNLHLDRRNVQPCHQQHWCWNRERSFARSCSLLPFLWEHNRRSALAYSRQLTRIIGDPQRAFAVRWIVKFEKRYDLQDISELDILFESFQDSERWREWMPLYDPAMTTAKTAASAWPPLMVPLRTRTPSHVDLISSVVF